MTWLIVGLILAVLLGGLGYWRRGGLTQPNADSLPAFERHVHDLLAAAAAPNRDNVLAAAAVFKSIGETHREIDQDSRAHGGSSAGMYWSLVMADWSYDEPAFFAAWFWREDSLTVCAGKGDRAAVMETCDEHTMEELEESFSAMDEKFHISGTSVSLSRSVAEPWAFAQGPAVEQGGITTR